MTRLDSFPGTIVNLFTLGIARGRWIAETNKRLGQGGAGFWFAWLLSPFANYGVVGRMNNALAQAGSSHRESPFLCFLLNGFPFIGAKKRMRRAAEALNNAYAVRQQATSVASHAAPVAPQAPPAAV